MNGFYLVNRPEDGLATQRRLFGRDQAPDVRYFLATRRLREAEPLIEDAMAREPNALALERLALLRALQARHAEAQALVPRILSIVQRNRSYHHVTYSIARIYALGGKVEDAARWMKETIDGGFPNYPLMASDTFLDPGSEMRQRFRRCWSVYARSQRPFVRRRLPLPVSTDSEEDGVCGNARR